MNTRKVKRMIGSFAAALKTRKVVEIPKQMNSNELLMGKVAQITGGSGGIGYAIAENFILNGAKVILAGTNKEKLEKLTEKLGSNKDKCQYIVLDVLDVSCMKEKIIEAAEKFEENRIDILVNSAGVLNESSFFDITEHEYERIMNINAKGTFFMSQEMAKYMIKNHIEGHILNVTSSSALRPAWTPYQMSKWAIRGFTMGLADTLLPYGITVNAIAPGAVATPMLGMKEGDNLYTDKNPLGRYALPREIASLATYMVSDMGRMIVGDTFYMTGGSGVIRYHE